MTQVDQDLKNAIMADDLVYFKDLITQFKANIGPEQFNDRLNDSKNTLSLLEWAAYYNASDIFNYLIDEQNADLHQKDNDHNNLIYYCLMSNPREANYSQSKLKIILKRLLEGGVELNRSQLDNVRYYMVSNGIDVVNMILDKYPQEDRHALFELAVNTGNVEVAKYFAPQKVDPDVYLGKIFKQFIDSNGFTHLGSDPQGFEQRSGIIKFLLQLGGNPNGQVTYYKGDVVSYLCLAVANKNYSIFRSLYEAGARKDTTMNAFTLNRFQEYKRIHRAEINLRMYARMLALASMDQTNTQGDKGVFYGVPIDVLILIATANADARIPDAHGIAKYEINKIRNQVVRPQKSNNDQPSTKQNIHQPESLEPVRISHTDSFSKLQNYINSINLYSYQEGPTHSDLRRFKSPFFKKSRGINRGKNYEIAELLASTIKDHKDQLPDVLSRIRKHGIFMQYTSPEGEKHTIRSKRLINIIKALKVNEHPPRKRRRC